MKRRPLVSERLKWRNAGESSIATMRDCVRPGPFSRQQVRLYVDRSRTNVIPCNSRSSMHRTRVLGGWSGTAIGDTSARCTDEGRKAPINVNDFSDNSSSIAGWKCADVGRGRRPNFAHWRLSIGMGMPALVPTAISNWTCFPRP